MYFVEGGQKARSRRRKRGGERGEENALTFSGPLLATVLVLFGIGYTIDYNSGFRRASRLRKLTAVHLKHHKNGHH